MNCPEFNETLSEIYGIRLAYGWEAYATHQPVLIWALENSTGPIVELGVGHYSTPLIAAVSQHEQRKALSLEDNAEWLKQYSSLATNLHRFATVTSWTDAIEGLAQTRWGLAFVDQSDHKMRLEAVRRLHGCCDLIVLHDSDMLPESKSDDYEWCEFFPKAPQPWPERGGPPTLLIRGRNEKGER